MATSAVVDWGAWAGLWEAIAASPIARTVAEAPWAYPALEAVHLLGIALLVGPILVFDLSVLGLTRPIDRATAQGLLLPFVWVGFAVNVVSGGLLFASNAVEFAGNPAFLAKIALIVVAGLNAAVFQARFTASAAPLATGHAEPQRLAEAGALLSLVTWVAVLVAGRLIAYVG
ncbi:MAG: hypothetical protein NW205_12250 [Hyphomicrobiaceae bacterium]|nr:hypothetical protein [Hyphomicrobiaceae bacterium]